MSLNKDLESIKSTFPELKAEIVEDEIVISNFKGNSEMKIYVSEEDVEVFKTLPMDKVSFLHQFTGIRNDKQIEVLLDVTDKRKRLYAQITFLREPIIIKMNYKSNPLNIIISKETNSPLGIINSLMTRQRTKIILSIENLRNELSEEELKVIIDCVLFDLHYNSNVMFEPIDSYPDKRIAISRKSKGKKREAFNFTYKQYSSELIEYYKTAERVDYLPFKYLCYFHIIEYFMDKSAYLLASQQIKHMMLKPDFHTQMDKYVGDAINLFKSESDRYQTDARKIRRVINHFINKKEILDFSKQKKINLESKTKFDCNDKELVLPTLNPKDKEEKFLDDLTTRIYRLRCSIVHSNPDFDEKKAIPFVITPNNLEVLKKDLQLIEEIAKIIILKTAE